MPRRIRQQPSRRGTRWVPNAPRGVIPGWLKQQMRTVGAPLAVTSSAARPVARGRRIRPSHHRPIGD
jgi:hypothetical protein